MSTEEAKDEQEEPKEQAAPAEASAPAEDAVAEGGDAASEQGEGQGDKPRRGGRRGKKGGQSSAPVGRHNHAASIGKNDDSGQRRGGRRGRQGDEKRDEGWVEHLVQVNRSAKVVKGGRRFGFSALLVLGDGMGRVGIGFGKANEVPSAVEKAKKDARKNMVAVNLVNDTIPHEVGAKFRASKVLLFPAPQGAGIIAGQAVRAVMEAAGVRNILSKCHGSNNRINVVKATMQALESLRTKEQVETLRGVKL